jgi:hypothetical protein
LSSQRVIVPSPNVAKVSSGKFNISPTQLFSEHNNNIATIKTHYEPKKLARLLGT